jgi:hypothetical protein
MCKVCAYRKCFPSIGHYQGSFLREEYSLSVLRGPSRKTFCILMSLLFFFSFPFHSWGKKEGWEELPTFYNFETL